MKLKNVVVLTAFDASDRQINHFKINLNDYYDQPHPMIDESAYRKGRNIRKIMGMIYDSKGNVLQEFENTYSDEGKYLHGKTKHSDGTVIQD